MSFHHKVILVVGSAKDLGTHVRQALELDGAKVVAHWRKTPLAKHNFSVSFEITAQSEVERGIEKIIKKWGRLDGVVNCVGPYHPKKITEISEGEWREDLESILHGAFFLTRAVLPVMREQKTGRIIYIGDAVVERVPSVTSISYKIAKQGLVTMARAFAQTESQHGITVNVVSPGIMPNSITRPPKGVAETPFEEVYKAIRFLLSEDARYITGTNLIASGGFFGM